MTLRLDSYTKRLRSAVRRALNEIGRMGKADVRQSLSVPVQRRGNMIFRSEPGEPPRKETGKLRKSIKYKVEPKAETVEQVSIFPTDPKAPWLEFGTEHIEPRPFMAPARRRFKTYAKPTFKELVKYYMELSNTGDEPADFESVVDDDIPASPPT